MTAPAGTVDLSLPDYPTLVARAGVNPDGEAARVANAVASDVSATGVAFRGAGGELDAAWAGSMGAQTAIGEAFVNDGAPVLDRATHLAQLPPEFREAGTRLAAASGRLDAVATDLAGTRQETAPR